jgi:hypothetical protein
MRRTNRIDNPPRTRAVGLKLLLAPGGYRYGAKLCEI